MSSIDSADNIHCANLHVNKLTVPVYWVVSKLHHDMTDNIVKKTDLLLGGGSGEHPMMQIFNADLLPLWLLTYNNEFHDSYDETLVEFYKNKMKQRIDEKNWEIFDYSPFAHQHFVSFEDWPLSSLFDIEQAYRNIEKSNDLSHLSSNSENAFLTDLALFILHDMPEEFFEPDILKKVKSIQDSDAELYKIARMCQFSRPLKSQRMGKINHNGKTIWQVDLDDYFRLTKQK